MTKDEILQRLDQIIATDAQFEVSDTTEELTALHDELQRELLLYPNE